jgi:hypothetical protein
MHCIVNPFSAATHAAFSRTASRRGWAKRGSSKIRILRA